MRTVELESSEGSSGQFLSQRTITSHSEFEFEDDGETHGGPSTPKKPRGMKNVLNTKLITVLDRAKLSDRMAVCIIHAVAESLHHDVNSFVLNRSSFRRYREKMRKSKNEEIRKAFKDVELKAMVLHWDGKMLPSLINREMADRLPIVVTNGDIEKILGIPELQNSKRSSQATAIFEVLSDWGLTDSVRALCCDTTSANLGHTKGAAVLLEQLLERPILYFPCRHHILELILRGVFEVGFPISTEPNVPLFKRFQQSWKTMNKENYKIGVENNDIRTVLNNHIDTIRLSVEKFLEQAQPRDDYKELLELSLIFIGIIPSDGAHFRRPGAFHLARWMAKAIYALKIYLFRDEFYLTAIEQKCIGKICIFIVFIYVETWFSAACASVAPNNDLKLLKRLCDYK